MDTLQQVALYAQIAQAVVVILMICIGIYFLLMKSYIIYKEAIQDFEVARNNNLLHHSRKLSDLKKHTRDKIPIRGIYSNCDTDQNNKLQKIFDEFNNTEKYLAWDYNKRSRKHLRKWRSQAVQSMLLSVQAGIINIPIANKFNNALQLMKTYGCMSSDDININNYEQILDISNAVTHVPDKKLELIPKRGYL